MFEDVTLKGEPLQILAIVAMSYDELQKKAEEEEEAALAEEEALRVSEELAKSRRHL